MNDKTKENVPTETDNEYWQDVEQKVLDPEYLKAEFGENELKFDIGSIKKDRRSFLTAMGFSFTALPLASCLKIPVKRHYPIFKKVIKSFLVLPIGMQRRWIPWSVRHFLSKQGKVDR